MSSKTISTKDLVTTALLIAIGILIPIIFTPLRVIVGPFTATLTAHVPVIIAMFISPWAAIFTAIGTAIGFVFSSPLVVAARAASHLIFAIVGAFMIQKRCNLILTWLVTTVLHALFEAIVVWLFFLGGISAPPAGYSSMIMVLITAIGTAGHHTVDYIIAYIIMAAALVRMKAVPPIPHLWRNK